MHIYFWLSIYYINTKWFFQYYNMKKFFLPYAFIFLFFCMLSHSDLTFAGALNGLELWLFTVVPSLLPYMIISSFMTESGVFQYLSRLLTPVTRYIFRLSPDCGYVILLGFVCGYPIGSKLSADMVRKGHISPEEGQILLSFCNNVSPAFLVTYLSQTILGISGHAGAVIFVMMAAPFLCGILFSRCYFAFSINSAKNTGTCAASKSIAKNATASPAATAGNANMDACISSGFEAIFKLGGYIILFSILNEFIGDYLSSAPLIQSRICSLCEITSGLNLYKSHGIAQSRRLVECTSLCAFGGFCCIAQTASMIRGSGLSLPLYILAKGFIALVTLLVVCLLF